MLRGRGQAQSLGATRDRRVVDRPYIDVEAFEEFAGYLAAPLGIANQDRDDVVLRCHDRQSRIEQPSSHGGGSLLEAIALDVARSEVADAGQCTGGENGRQTCGTDEAWRKAP